MYVIAGVTGHTGSIVADALLARGERVRVLVREPAKGEPWRARGAEVAVASVDDTAAVTAALSGARGAYLLLPPRMASTTPVEDNARVTASLRAAVAAAKVPHVVLLSSIGAQHEDGTGPIKTLHLAERELAATGAAVTAIRAAYFLENWGASLGAVAQGILPTFLPADLAIPMVATADIGRVAAGALVEAAGGVIELAGPRDYSSADIAAAVGAITGAPVRAHEAPLDAVVPTFTGFGVSAAIAALYREMYEGIIAGKVAYEGGAARLVRGTVSAEDVLRGLLGKR